MTIHRAHSKILCIAIACAPPLILSACAPTPDPIPPHTHTTCEHQRSSPCFPCNVCPAIERGANEGIFDDEVERLFQKSTDWVGETLSSSELVSSSPYKALLVQGGCEIEHSLEPELLHENRLRYRSKDHFFQLRCLPDVEDQFILIDRTEIQSLNELQGELSSLCEYPAINKERSDLSDHAYRPSDVYFVTHRYSERDRSKSDGGNVLVFDLQVMIHRGDQEDLVLYSSQFTSRLQLKRSPIGYAGWIPDE